MPETLREMNSLLSLPRSMRVRWLRRALQNLDDEATCSARANPAAAHEYVAHVLALLNQLAVHLDIGRAGRVFGTRELVITRYPYIVPYRMNNRTVEILHVFHTSRSGRRVCEYRVNKRVPAFASGAAGGEQDSRACGLMF